MILVGDCREQLRTLPERSVQTCVTSPPYFGLRDYGHDGQIGLEPTPGEFVAALVGVFREVRRVLRDDGTVWLNLGDSYANDSKWGGSSGGKHVAALHGNTGIGRQKVTTGLKGKDLIGIPWMVAFALRTDGWYLRSDIIWAKPNPMPESVTDRPTKAHEYLFLLSKGPRYFYDADAVREQGKDWSSGGPGTGIAPTTHYHPENGGNEGLSALAGRYKAGEQSAGRNKRSVWAVATQPYAGAHFATFPPRLIEPCTLAGSSPRACGVCGAPWRRVVEVEPDDRPTSGDTAPYLRDSGRMDSGRRARSQNGGGAEFARAQQRTVGWEASCDHDDDTGSSVVLDPFAGAGTVGVVCGWHGRDFIGCELNPAYAEMARERIALEGRPGGPPASHEPAAIVNGQGSLLDLLGGEAA